MTAKDSCQENQRNFKSCNIDQSHKMKFISSKAADRLENQTYKRGVIGFNYTKIIIIF